MAPTTSHHQAFSKSTPFCNRASESCTGFLQLPQRTASKPRQLIISATCWQEMPNPYLTNNRTSATSHLNLEGLQRHCQVEKMSIVPPERVLTLALQDADRAYPSRLNPGWNKASTQAPDTGSRRAESSQICVTNTVQWSEFGYSRGPTVSALGRQTPLLDVSDLRRPRLEHGADSDLSHWKSVHWHCINLVKYHLKICTWKNHSSLQHCAKQWSPLGMGSFTTIWKIR